MGSKIGSSIPSNAPGTGLFRVLTIAVGVLFAAVVYLVGTRQMPDLGPKPAPTPVVTTTTTVTASPITSAS